MVNDVSKYHLVILFIEILANPLKGLVKPHQPSTLQDAMDNTQDLQDVIPKTRSPPKSNFPSIFKDKIHFQKCSSGDFNKDKFYTY